MKAVIVSLAFGIFSALINAREIVNENSGNDGSGSYGEGFGGGNGFAYGDRKTNQQFRAYVNPFGNIISRANGGVIETGGGLYPRIIDNGKVVYTKSDYRNHGSYDSSTITYGLNGNSRISEDFDGRGVFDVRSNIGSDESRRTADYSGFKGFNSGGENGNNESGFKSDAISASASSGINPGYGDLSRPNGNSGGFVRNYERQDGYKGVNSGLGGIGNQYFHDGLRGSEKFGGLGGGNNFLTIIGKPFQFIPGIFQGWGSGSGLNGVKPILSQLPGGGLNNQKLDEEYGNSNGETAPNICGSGSCSGHSENGKYAFASASASAGNYGK